jgi:putative endonuclease
MQKSGSVYIMASANKNVLYTGVTSELANRVWKHQTKFYPDSFSARYNCVVLVYYKHFFTIEEAIIEEKRIKGGSRQQKEKLINGINPEWKDLSEELF